MSRPLPQIFGFLDAAAAHACGVAKFLPRIFFVLQARLLAFSFAVTRGVPLYATAPRLFEDVFAEIRFIHDWVCKSDEPACTSWFSSCLAGQLCRLHSATPIRLATMHSTRRLNEVIIFMEQFSTVFE